MPRRYIDFGLIEQHPNKYNITPKGIKKLRILDWEKLKKHTWHNNAMLPGNWWCHLEGANIGGRYDDEDEFWIGFNEDNGEIDYHFSSYGGMCGYKFDKFYNLEDIGNIYDMHVQVNAIKWFNEMIDREILGVNA